MPIYQVRHVTTYRYKSPVAFGEHRMMLRPRESFDQRTLSWSVDIAPSPLSVAWSEDPSGNLVGLARFAPRARELVVSSTARVEQTEYELAGIAVAEHARAVPFSYGADLMPDLARFIERQHPDPDHAVDGWARAILAEDPDRSTTALLGRFNRVVRRDFAYLRREEKGIQEPAFTLRHRRGSCRDFAALVGDALRALGLAVRFVSGYLNTGSVDPQAALAGGSTHAWLQTYLPGAGWIDVDPTSGAVGNRGLIRVAAVRDLALAAPLTGSFLGFPRDFDSMSVAVDVVRVDDRDREPVHERELGLDQAGASSVRMMPRRVRVRG